MGRKVIQIATVQEREGDKDPDDFCYILLALCDDGNIFEYDTWETKPKWRKIPSIPEGELDER